MYVCMHSRVLAKAFKFLMQNLSSYTSAYVLLLGLCVISKVMI